MSTIEENAVPVITIGTIETRPEHDPYVNIAGIMSRTYLTLDPRDRTIRVTQEYRTNSTSSDRWHGRVLTWHIPFHPLESTMREWIVANMTLFETICKGFTIEWDGHNQVGRLTEDARSAKDAIQYVLDNGGGPDEYYDWYAVEDWLYGELDAITGDTTDEQLAAIAADCAPPADTIVLGDILAYLTAYRDDLRDEAANADA